jgi:glyoxylase-like metal-dependent hydrolase (beta-lactamase superfamily II)
MTTMTRRSVLASLAASPLMTTSTLGAPAPLITKRISERGWFIGDGGYNNLAIVGDRGVVLCDAPPSYGLRLMPAIRSITPLPVTHLIYSHEHVDHIAGAGALDPRPEIIASAATATLLERRNDPARPPPTRIAADGEKLVLDGAEIEIRVGPPSHSIDTNFILAPNEKVLMAVDLVYPGWMPYKNLGVAIDLPGVVTAHDMILGLSFEVLVAGHVDRAGTREDVAISLELYRDLAASAKRCYEALSFPQYLASSGSSLTSWEQHQNYETELVRRMVADVRPRWIDRLKGVDTYLADNCWAMLETFVVQGEPVFAGKAKTP